MKRITKKQFYQDRKKTAHPPKPEKGRYSTALSDVLFDNLFPIDQFFILQCDSELKDEDNLERAIHILRSMFEKLSNDLWKFDSEVTKHLGEVSVYRPRAGWETEQRGVDPIGVKVYRAWFADDAYDDEDHGSEKVEAEETSERVRELFGG